MGSNSKELREQAQLHRAAHQQHRIKAQEELRNQQAISLGFDAEVGLERVQLADGSVAYAEPNTTGARGVGDAVLMHQGQGMVHVDASPTVVRSRSQPERKPLKKEVYPFKVLFSITDYLLETVIFYLGGDRKTPLEIVRFSPTDVYVSESYVVNTGKNKDDWIVTMRYWEFDTNTIIIRSFGKTEDTWQFSCPQNPLYKHEVRELAYKGGGVWMTEETFYPTPVENILVQNIDYANGMYEDHRIYSYPYPNYMGGDGSIYGLNERTSNVECAGSPYYYDYQNHYFPIHLKRDVSYHFKIGSFILYKNQLRKLLGNRDEETHGEFYHTCANQLREEGNQAGNESEIHSVFLSNTIIGESSNSFHRIIVSGGLNPVNHTDNSDLYEDCGDVCILVGADGSTCLSSKIFFHEVIQQQGTHESYGLGDTFNETGNKSSSATFFLNKTSLYQQEINNAPSFSFNSPQKLNINETTASIVLTFPTHRPLKVIESVVTSHTITPGQPTQINTIPSPLDLIGMPVSVAQIANPGKTEYWSASGVISDYDSFISPDQNPYGDMLNITSITITFNSVQKTPYDYFATENGNIRGENNSIIPLFFADDYIWIAEGGDYGIYKYPYYGDSEYLSNANLVQGNVYFARNHSGLLTSSSDNYAEVWEFVPNGSQSDAVKSKLVKGKVYSLGAPPDHETNPDVPLYEIKGISYFPLISN